MGVDEPEGLLSAGRVVLHVAREKQGTLDLVDLERNQEDQRDDRGSGRDQEEGLGDGGVEVSAREWWQRPESGGRPLTCPVELHLRKG